MKECGLTIVFLLYIASNAHGQYFDCISEEKYQIVQMSEAEMRTKEGRFTVCYIDKYFSFILPGGSQTGFWAEDVNGGVDENGYTYSEFINGETHTMVRGSYMVKITYGKQKVIDIQNTLAGIMYRVKAKNFLGKDGRYTVTKIKQQNTTVTSRPIDTFPKGDTLKLNRGKFYPITIKR